MKRLEVSGAVRPIYGSLGVKRLNISVTLCIVICETGKQSRQLGPGFLGAVAEVVRSAHYLSVRVD